MQPRSITLSLPAIVTLWIALSGAHAAEGTADGRTRLGLDEGERAFLLGEMRGMLGSIQGVIAGIGAGDRAGIADAARASGNRMARETPASIRDKLPPGFRQLGGPTHMMFEELAVRAENDEMEDLALFTGELMQQCLGCHAQFRAD